MPPAHDSRLLQNLLKAEKDAQLSFSAWTKDAASASTALTAWSVAGSSDTQDLMDVSMQLSHLVATCAASQRRYLHALAAYRTSLKAVLEREASVKTVIRDREILVGRLVKLANKRPTDAAVPAHDSKVAEAQKELAACEAFLQDEEAALSALKRLTFSDSLALRMRAMGDLGRVMDETAREAIALLRQLGDSSDFPEFLRQARADDVVSLDSITPSHSASQALSPTPSATSLALDDVQLPDDVDVTPTLPQLNGAAHGKRAVSPPPLPVPPPPPLPQQSTSPTRIIRSQAPPAIPALAASLPSAPPKATAVMAAAVASTTMPDPPPIVIPKAPAHVSTIGPNDDSSDEEFDSVPLQVNRGGGGGGGAGAGAGGSGASGPGRGGLGPRSTVYGAAPPPPPASPAVARLRRRAMSDSGDSDIVRKRHGSFFGGIASLFRRKGKSSAGRNDDDDDDDEDSVRRFRLRRSAGTASSGGGGWETRTDRNLRLANRSSTQVGPSGTFHLGRTRKESVGGRDSNRGMAASSSDDDDLPRNVVRVVNDPKLRVKAFSDLGRSPSITTARTAPVSSSTRANKRTSVASAALMRASSPSTVTMTKRDKAHQQQQSVEPPPQRIPGEVRKIRKVKKAASDIGISTRASSPPQPSASLAPPMKAPRRNSISVSAPSTPLDDATPTPSVSARKKKKKVVEPAETVVLTVTPDMILPQASSSTPTPTATPGLSRSGTVTTTGTVKKRRERASLQTVASLATQPRTSPPTADDLSASLPSARTSMYAAYPGTLERPPPPTKTASTAPVTTVTTEDNKPGKVPKSVGEGIKRSREEAIKFGSESFVANPNSHGHHHPHAHPHHHHSHSNNNSSSSNDARHPVTVGGPGHEADESLMAIVDRDQRADAGTAKTSRTYAREGATPEEPPGSLLLAETDTAARENKAAARRSRGSHGANGDATGATGTGAGGTGGTSTGVARRKSVRLADGPSRDLVLPAHSPPSSIRSESLPVPRHGILVNNNNSGSNNYHSGTTNHHHPHHPHPDPALSAALSPSHTHPHPGMHPSTHDSSHAHPSNENHQGHQTPSGLATHGWATRVSTGEGTAAEDSSDEDEDAVAYKAARRAFAKGTKGYKNALGTTTNAGGVKRRDTGKAKAE